MRKVKLLLPFLLLWCLVASARAEDDFGLWGELKSKRK